MSADKYDQALLLWGTEGGENKKGVGVNLHQGPSGSLWANERQDLVREDKGEEVNTEVGEDVPHPPVGVHGAVDDLSGDAGQQQGSGQHSGLGLLLYLEEQEYNAKTLKHLAGIYSQ